MDKDNINDLVLEYFKAWKELSEMEKEIVKDITKLLVLEEEFKIEQRQSDVRS